MKLTKHIWVLIVLGLAAFSPAPIKDLRRNVVIQPEKSQPQVEEDQKNHQMVRPPVANAPLDTEVPLMDSGPTSDTDAENALTANESQREADLTEQNIKEGKDSMGRKEGSDTMWLWGIVFAAVGFGLVFAFKQVAGRSIPDMPGNFKDTSKDTSKKRGSW